MEKETHDIACISKQLKHISDSKDNLVNELKVVHDKLDSLNKKYDAIVELKKEKLQEIKKDRQERKRHYKAIEKHNTEMLKKKVLRLELKLKLIELEQEKLMALSPSN